MKKLKETCEDLAEANQRLLAASDFYTNTPKSPIQTNSTPKSKYTSPVQPRNQPHVTRPVPASHRVIKQAIPQHSGGLKAKAPVMSIDYVVFGDHGVENFNEKPQNDFTFMTSNNNDAFDM